MTTYYRIAENEVPFDAVTIAIGERTQDEIEAGLFWPPRFVDGKQFDAGTELPGDVETAFTRAQDIARERGFDRIAVMLQHDGLWHEDWGTLVDAPEPEPILDLLWAPDEDVLHD